MAAKKQISISDDLSYEDMCKVIKGIKCSTSTYIGKKEIESEFTLKRLRTGIPTIDFLGSGGIIQDRITIFAGNVSSSKSTMSLQTVAEYQRISKENNKSKFCLWYDSEGAYDIRRAEQLGIDQTYMILKKGKVVEDVFEEIDNIISTGFIGFLVIDSLDALTPRKVDESEYGNSMGGASGAVSMHLPKLFNKLMECHVTTILIKQCRESFNSMGRKILTFSGGKALRHFADSIYMVNRLSNLNLSYTPISVKAEKTRSSRMGMTLETPLFEHGIDKIRDLINIAISHDIINQAGSWLTYSENKWQGTERCVAALREDTDIYNKLYNEIYSDIIESNILKIESVEDNTILQDE